jgi:hypothetical protein
MKAAILTILSILLILFPALTLEYVDKYQLDTIEAEIQTNGIINLGSGDYINAMTGNKTTLITNEIDDLLDNIGFPPLSPRPIPALDKNTIMVKFSGFKSGIWNYTVNLNNTNVAYVLDWNITPGFMADTVFTVMNYTTHNLTSYDALIVDYDVKHKEWGLFFNNPDYIYGWLPFNFYGLPVDNDTLVIPISTELKLQLLSYPDTLIWSYFNLLNYTQPLYSWSIEIADTTNIFSVKPLILTEVILISIIIPSFIALLFSTDAIDIAIGNKKTNGGNNE